MENLTLAHAAPPAGPDLFATPSRGVDVVRNGASFEAALAETGHGALAVQDHSRPRTTAHEVAPERPPDEIDPGEATHRGQDRTVTEEPDFRKEMPAIREGWQNGDMERAEEVPVKQVWPRTVEVTSEEASVERAPYKTIQIASVESTDPDGVRSQLREIDSAEEAPVRRPGAGGSEIDSVEETSVRRASPRSEEIERVERAPARRDRLQTDEIDSADKGPVTRLRTQTEGIESVEEIPVRRAEPQAEESDPVEVAAVRRFRGQAEEIDSGVPARDKATLLAPDGVPASPAASAALFSTQGKHSPGHLTEVPFPDVPHSPASAPGAADKVVHETKLFQPGKVTPEVRGGAAFEVGTTAEASGAPPVEGRSPSTLDLEALGVRQLTVTGAHGEGLPKPAAPLAIRAHESLSVRVSENLAEVAAHDPAPSASGKPTAAETAKAAGPLPVAQAYMEASVTSRYVLSNTVGPRRTDGSALHASAEGVIGPAEDRTPPPTVQMASEVPADAKGFSSNTTSSQAPLPRPVQPIESPTFSIEPARRVTMLVGNPDDPVRVSLTEAGGEISVRFHSEAVVRRALVGSVQQLFESLAREQVPVSDVAFSGRFESQTDSGHSNEGSGRSFRQSSASVVEAEEAPLFTTLFESSSSDSRIHLTA